MPKRKHVVMLECIPKGQEQDESEVLFQFLRMTLDGGDATKIDVAGKSDLLEVLAKDDDVASATYIHISAHGDGDEPALHLPRGKLGPSAFPEGCFKGKVVSLSACSLGRKAFMDEFIEQTGAKAVVAPTHDVLFPEAAIFFVNFYFLLLHDGMTPNGAFERVKRTMGTKVKGGFGYWTAE